MSAARLIAVSAGRPAVTGCRNSTAICAASQLDPPLPMLNSRPRGDRRRQSPRRRHHGGAALGEERSLARVAVPRLLRAPTRAARRRILSASCLPPCRNGYRSCNAPPLGHGANSGHGAWPRSRPAPRPVRAAGPACAQPRLRRCGSSRTRHAPAPIRRYRIRRAPVLGDEADVDRPAHAAHVHDRQPVVDVGDFDDPPRNA